jgi:hypothetical protein
VQDAPRDLGELRARQAAREEAREQARREQAERLEAERRTATVVVADKLTLREAASRIEGNGGRLEVTRDGRLLVMLPDKAKPFRVREVAVLYADESVVVEHLRGGKALPDKPVTPAGALVP